MNVSDNDEQKTPREDEAHTGVDENKSDDEQETPRQDEAHASVDEEIDSWYSWLIVVACFSVAFAVLGTQYSAGIINATLLDEFGESRSVTSWVVGMSNGIMLMSALGAGWMQAYVGQRITVAVGGSLAATGLLLSSFVDEVWQLYLTFGCIGGLGQGLSFLAAFSAVQFWFSAERRNLATGLATAGSGAGTACLGIVTRLLIDEFGWRIAFRFLAAIVMVMVVGPAAAFRVPKAHQNGAVKSLKGVLLLPGMLRLLLVLFVFGLGAWVPVVYNTRYAEDEGLSKGEAAAATVLFHGIASTIGRPITAIFMDRVGRRRGFWGILASSGVICCLVPTMISTYALVALNNFAYGWVLGSFISSLPPLTVELFGVEFLNQAIGIIFCSLGVSMTVGPPIFGAMRDNLGDYLPGYQAFGGVMLLASVGAATLPYWDLTLQEHAEPAGADATNQSLGLEKMDSATIIDQPLHHIKSKPSLSNGYHTTETQGQYC